MFILMAPLKKVMALDDIRWIFLFWVFDITTFLEGEVHFHAPIDTATWFLKPGLWEVV